VGMILGPAAGGFLAAISVQIPFFSSAALALLVAGIAHFFLPESLPLALRAVISTTLEPHSGRFKALLRELRGPLAFLMILGAFSSLGIAQLESTGALYAKACIGARELENFQYPLTGSMA
jgi:MFS family permease